MSAERGYTGDPDIDQLLFRWRRVIADATDEWARGFALSIQRARKRPGWMPSHRQLAVMRRLVAELPPVAREYEPDLIED